MTIAYEVNDKLYLNITNRCPCSCEFCIRNNGEGVYGSDPLWLDREPSNEEIIAELNSRDLNRYSEIVFCGYGEPTERIDSIVAVCDFLKGVEHPPVRINTNGLSDLINGKPTACLFAGRVDVVSVSLNTSDKEKYFKLCKPSFGMESYEAMLDFAVSCKQYVEHVQFSIVDVIPPAEIEDCRRLADKLGIFLRVRKYDS